MTDYLPKDATIEQVCAWLQAKTGQTWILPRLLECHLTPHFWLDYKPGYPVIFGGRIEGYQTRMMFQGDLRRLEADGADALVSMFAAHDGSLIKVEPGLRVPLVELRFKRADVERVAEIINKSKATPAPAETTAPVVADGPAPLTTGDIAHCFNGLRGWSEKQWKDTLGEVKSRRWLQDCVVIPSSGKGGSETRWNPVFIAGWLVRQGYVNARTVRAKFQTIDLLQPWIDYWKTYEADNFETQS